LQPLNAPVFLKIISANVKSPPSCLDDRRCLIFTHVFGILVPVAGQLSFDVRLKFYEPLSDPLDFLAGFEPSEDSLDVDNKVLLSVH